MWSPLLKASAVHQIGFSIKHCRLVVALGVMLSVGSMMAGAQARYEAPAVLHAAEIVPSELLQSPLYTIDERVTTEGL